VQSSFGDDYLDKEYALGTSDGVCFVKITQQYEIKQTTEYFLRQLDI
jgi:hypothetical protein